MTVGQSVAVMLRALPSFYVSSELLINIKFKMSSDNSFDEIMEYFINFVNWWTFFVCDKYRSFCC